MPAKEIKEHRQAGKLAEAYAMAKAELEADLSNIWRVCGQSETLVGCFMNILNKVVLWDILMNLLYGLKKLKNYNCLKKKRYFLNS